MHKPIHTPTHNPINQPCLRNQDPIFQKLQQFFKDPGSVLELACGTAQHAVYFSQRLPHLNWQPSDLPNALPGANLWINDATLNNLNPAIAIDISNDQWTKNQYDYAYCANLIHFVSQEDVSNIFKGIQRHLKKGGLLAVYGPFNQQGFTSDGNRGLDLWLKSEIHPQAGIKELDDIKALAEQHQLILQENESMPANNRLLLFRLQE